MGGRRWWGGGRRLGEQEFAGNETSGDDIIISKTGADAVSNASHVVNLTRRRCWFQRRPWNCGRLLAKSNTSSTAITSEGENANGTEELKAGRWGRRWWGGGRRLGEQEFAGNETSGDDIIISKTGADAVSNASHVVNLTRRRCWFQRRPWNCGRLLAKSNASS